MALPAGGALRGGGASPSEIASVTGSVATAALNSATNPLILENPPAEGGSGVIWIVLVILLLFLIGIVLWLLNRQGTPPDGRPDDCAVGVEMGVVRESGRRGSLTPTEQVKVPPVATLAESFTNKAVRRPSSGSVGGERPVMLRNISDLSDFDDPAPGVPGCEMSISDLSELDQPGQVYLSDLSDLDEPQQTHELDLDLDPSKRVPGLMPELSDLSDLDEPAGQTSRATELRASLRKSMVAMPDDMACMSTISDLSDLDYPCERDISDLSELDEPGVVVGSTNNSLFKEALGLVDLSDLSDFEDPRAGPEVSEKLRVEELRASLRGSVVAEPRDEWAVLSDLSDFDEKPEASGNEKPEANQKGKLALPKQRSREAQKKNSLMTKLDRQKDKIAQAEAAQDHDSDAEDAEHTKRHGERPEEFRLFMADAADCRRSFEEVRRLMENLVKDLEKETGQSAGGLVAEAPRVHQYFCAGPHEGPKAVARNGQVSLEVKHLQGTSDEGTEKWEKVTGVDNSTYTSLPWVSLRKMRSRCKTAKVADGTRMTGLKTLEVAEIEVVSDKIYPGATAERQRLAKYKYLTIAVDGTPKAIQAAFTTLKLEALRSRSFINPDGDDDEEEDEDEVHRLNVSYPRFISLAQALSVHVVEPSAVGG